MMKGKEIALSLLQEGNTCVLVGNGKTLCSTKRGVAPLLAWLENKENGQGMIAADKVVGRAAAFLYVLLGVKEVYALVISEGAEEVFLRFKVAYSFEERVPAIRNRAGDGFCPMEQAVLSIDEPNRAYEEICRTIQVLKEKEK